MPKLITVFGSTGNQGGSVIRAILAHPQLSKDWKIRGITRNANKPDAQALAAQGVEMISVRPPLSPSPPPIHTLTLTPGRSQLPRLPPRRPDQLHRRLRRNKLLGKSLARARSPTRPQPDRRLPRRRRRAPHLVHAAVRVQDHSGQTVQPAPLRQQSHGRGVHPARRAAG